MIFISDEHLKKAQLSEIVLRVYEFLEEKIVPLEGKRQNVLIVVHFCLNHCIFNPILGISNNCT